MTIAACGALAAADEPPSAVSAEATPAARPTAVVDSTQMIGSLPPQVVGRWLFVIRATTDLGDAASTSHDLTDDSGKTTTITRTQVGGTAAPIVRTLQLSGKDAQATLVLHSGPFPADLRKQVLPEKAAAGATPEALPPVDPKALAEVDRRWSELARPAEGPRLLTSKLLDYRNVSDDDKQRLGVPSAQLIIVTDESFEGGKTLLKNVSTFAVEQMTPEKLEGQFLGAMVMPAIQSGNLAIPPTPLVLKGRFVAYNLDAVGGSGARAASSAGAQGAATTPAPQAARVPAGVPQSNGGSFVQRLLGTFSGCGGR